MITESSTVDDDVPDEAAEVKMTNQLDISIDPDEKSDADRMVARERQEDPVAG